MKASLEMSTTLVFGTAIPSIFTLVTILYYTDTFTLHIVILLPEIADLNHSCTKLKIYSTDQRKGKQKPQATRVLPAVIDVSARGSTMDRPRVIYSMSAFELLHAHACTYVHAHARVLMLFIVRTCTRVQLQCVCTVLQCVCTLLQCTIYTVCGLLGWFT